MKVGDILGFSFRNKGLTYFFEGICMVIRDKGFVHPETGFILRNVLSGVGIELAISYFYNRGFFFKINNFKRKRDSYRQAKLYYIREKLRRESRVF